MGMGGIKHHLSRGELVLLGNPGLEAGVDTGSQAKGISANNDGTVARCILQSQGLGPERVQGAFTGFGATAVTGHPDGFLGRDIGLGSARLPRGSWKGQGKAKQKKDPQRSHGEKSKIQWPRVNDQRKMDGLKGTLLDVESFCCVVWCPV